MKNEVERLAIIEGMNAQRDIQWAQRHLNPNTTMTIVMGWVMGIIALLIIAAVASDPEGWPILFFAALFGGGALVAGPVARDERRDQAKAKEILRKWDRRVTELTGNSKPIFGEHTQ